MKNLGNAKLVIVWILMIVFTLLTLIVGYTIFTNYKDSLPKRITQIGDVRLGDTYDDFMFRTTGFSEDKDKSREYKTYRSEDNRYIVFILNERVTRIIYNCISHDDLIYLNTVTCGTNGDDVLAFYLDSIAIKCRRKKDEESYSKVRAYDAAAYNVRHHLVENKVVAFDVAEGSLIQSETSLMNKNWDKCMQGSK